jgi:very-short-patch-repair endonuclease
MENKLDIFKKKAKLVHGDRYDYSLVIYKNTRTKIKIICPIHGEFEQILNNHLMGSGCNECNNNNKKAKIGFLNKANIKHNYKYGYSLVNYINNKIKVKIICPIHGEFQQKPNDHLTGNGCSLCGNKNLNKQTFIEKAKLIHGDKYGYSLVNYINNKVKVKIICPIHDSFEQRVDHHLIGAGCPLCKESRGEREIRKFFLNNNIDFIRQKRFSECRDKKPLPFDFYLPNHKTCVEFNGRQHYSSVPYWGGDDNFKKQQKRDNIKLNYCKKNNIILIIIDNIKEINENLKWMNQK